MTINNFDENIDDSLATLDNIVIMTINTRTVSLKLDDIILTSALCTYITYSLGKPRLYCYRQTSCQTGEAVMATLVGTSVAMFGWC